jgi:hypothetical protein
MAGIWASPTLIDGVPTLLIDDDNQVAAILVENTPPRTGYILYYYDVSASAWTPVTTNIFMWNGSSWVLETRPVNLYINGNWEQLNPNAP